MKFFSRVTRFGGGCTASIIEGDVGDGAPIALLKQFLDHQNPLCFSLDLERKNDLYSRRNIEGNMIEKPTEECQFFRPALYAGRKFGLKINESVLAIKSKPTNLLEVLVTKIVWVERRWVVATHLATTVARHPNLPKTTISKLGLSMHIAFLIH